jgi:hypothetical protein
MNAKDLIIILKYVAIVLIREYNVGRRGTSLWTLCLIRRISSNIRAILSILHQRIESGVASTEETQT